MTLCPETGRLEPAADDKRLPGLQQALAAGEELKSWRIGRRAILRRSDDSWRKVTRPTKVDQIANSWQHPTTSAVATPRLLAIDANTLTIEHLSGTPLHEILPAKQADLLPTIAKALTDWHSATPGSLASWEPDRPEQWTGTIARADPAFARTLHAVANELPPMPTQLGAHGLVHGDLHDKNIIITPQRTIGFIDLDDLRCGPIEADAANFAAHLTLRSLQQRQPPDAAVRQAHSFLDHITHHTAIDQPLAHTLLAHTYFRLAALYHLRPQPEPVVTHLLTAALSETSPCRP